MNRCRLLVPLIFPRTDFTLQLGKAFDSSVEALPGRYIQLDLGHVQPAAMLQRMVYFQTPRQSGGLICGQCGGWYGAKVWHSTDKYRRTIYRCNDKFKNHCQTPHLTENEIKGAFIRAVNQLIENKEDILSNITMLKKRLTDTASLEKERDALELDLNMLTDQVQQLIAENAQVAQDQDEYGRKYNGLVSRYEETKKKYDQVCDAIQQCVDRYWKLDNFMKNLQKQNLVYEFDERLWCSLVDFIIVYSKVKIQIVFKNGTKIHVGM